MMKERLLFEFVGVSRSRLSLRLSKLVPVYNMSSEPRETRSKCVAYQPQSLQTTV